MSLLENKGQYIHFVEGQKVVNSLRAVLSYLQVVKKSFPVGKDTSKIDSALEALKIAHENYEHQWAMNVNYEMKLMKEEIKANQYKSECFIRDQQIKKLKKELEDIKNNLVH